VTPSGSGPKHTPNAKKPKAKGIPPAKPWDDEADPQDAWTADGAVVAPEHRG